MAATKYIRVLVTFTHQSDHQIEEILGAVITSMTGNQKLSQHACRSRRRAGSSYGFTAAIATQACTTRIHRTPVVIGNRGRRFY